MITFSNGGRLIQTASELPNLLDSDSLFLDFETSSGNPKLDSLNPWKNCRIIGIAVTADNHKESWYVSPDLVPSAWQWISDIIWSCKRWINHNIKYDLHCLANDTNILENTDWPFEVICTLTLAKIIASDRLSNSLDSLAKDWLKKDITKHEERLKRSLGKSKDYGDVPYDIIGEYACEDVISTREIYEYELEKLPEQCQGVWETEKKITCSLYDTERVGLCIDRTELQLNNLSLLNDMLDIEQKIHNICGHSVRPNTNADCHELFACKYGLPVIEWTEAGLPSYDKKALQTLLVSPIVHADPKLKEIVELCLEYRKKKTLNGLFVETYQELEVDGRIHSFYNQIVRTGRMSCRNPNAQQLSKAAKELIHPTPGYVFVSRDYSQIEFRIIVHYLNNERAIYAYLTDPNTDFHDLIAKLAGIPRKSAKNLNFAIAFSAGKKKVLTMLSGDVALVGHLYEQADGNIALFNMLAAQHARYVYTQYHQMLPELKMKSKQASNTAISRGYVYGLYGRRRYIPQKLCFIAFNSVVQGSAADVLKDRAIATAPRYNQQIKNLGARQVALVHDEFLFEVPKENVQEFKDVTTPILENPNVKLRVPIRVSCGTSDVNWRLASGE